MRRVSARSLATALTGLAFLGFSDGCSRRTDDPWIRARPATRRVSGRVLQNGGPVAGAKVQFVRRTSPGEKSYIAFGITDAGGRFTLQTFRAGDGAVAGTHDVAIEKITLVEKPLPANAEFPPPAEEISELPSRYRSPETSGLMAEIAPGGPNTFQFVLERE